MNRNEWDALNADEQFSFAYDVNRLTDRYEELMRLIPECPEHGYLCISHAKEWVEKMKKLESEE